MVYVINDKCICCGACAEICKTKAARGGKDRFYIDPAKCAACGACADICPVKAPRPENIASLSQEV